MMSDDTKHLKTANTELLPYIFNQKLYKERNTILYCNLTNFILKN